MKHMKRALVIALMVLFATPAWSQDVLIKKPAPSVPREVPDVIPPGLQQETRPSDADRYPRGGQVQYDPAFIGPMSKPRESATDTGRYGVAGWLSPTTPVGSPATGWRESNGVFAFGFSITWDGPPPARRPATAP
jgi:hypothetical protein